MLSELGSCEKFSDLGPYAKQGVNKDLYNLGMYTRCITYISMYVYV